MSHIEWKVWMPDARPLRGPSPKVAALFRLTAFLVAAVSMVLVPVVLAGAATGHGSVPHAFVTVAVASALTTAMALAARGLDPLRR